MPSQQDYMAFINTIWPLALMFVVMYFFLIRPQRKRDKAEKEMRAAITVGDEVSTIGGIIGKVVSVKEDDDSIVIETSGDRTKIKFYRWAIRERKVNDVQTDKK